MSNAEAAPDSAGTAEQENSTVTESFEAAVNSLTDGTSESGEQSTGEGAESTPERTGTVAEEPEPEHVKWAKSIEGDFDKGKGEFNLDRVLKRSFESNRQAQDQAQRLNRLEQLIKHPEIAKAVLKALSPQDSAESGNGNGTAPEDLTDEQRYRNEVKKIAEDVVSPLKDKTEMVFRRLVETSISDTRNRLVKEFGEDDGGTPLYDSVKDQVGQQVNAAAQRAGMSTQAFVEELVRQDMLYDTLAATARNLLYPRQVETITKLRGKSVQDKKRVNLPGRGTPSTGVSAAAKEITSVADAARLAYEEHPELKELE